MGNKSVDILQANIRMRSYGVSQLVDDKSVASCQQTCCMLIVKTCYRPGLPQIASTSSTKSANDKLQQALILTNILQLDEETDKFVATC